MTLQKLSPSRGDYKQIRPILNQIKLSIAVVTPTALIFRRLRKQMEEEIAQQTKLAVETPTPTLPEILQRMMIAQIQKILTQLK